MTYINRGVWTVPARDSYHERVICTLPTFPLVWRLLGQCQFVKNVISARCLLALGQSGDWDGTFLFQLSPAEMNPSGPREMTSCLGSFIFEEWRLERPGQVCQRQLGC